MARDVRNVSNVREHMQRLAICVAVALVVLIMFVGIFVAALHKPTPHGVPVGLVAPPPVVQRVEAGMSAKSPGAFSIHVYPTPAAAEAALRNHDIDGAFVVGRGPAHLDLASAAGPVPTAVITAAFTGLAKAAHIPVVTQDLVPLPSGDPRSAIPYYLVFGLMISSIMFPVAVYLLVRHSSIELRLAALAAYAVIGGLVSVLVANLVAGIGADHYLRVAVIAMLVSLAVSATTAAIERLVGLPGTGIAAMLFIVLGNATSGGAVNYEFMPDFFRQVSQFLPPGAGLTAIRNAAYFNGNSLTSQAVLVLVIWILVGLALLVAEGYLRPVRAREAL
jgi:hypothetical protein